jgi:hypothetical protein
MMNDEPEAIVFRFIIHRLLHPPALNCSTPNFPASARPAIDTTAPTGVMKALSKK